MLVTGGDDLLQGLGSWMPWWHSEPFERWEHFRKCGVRVGSVRVLWRCLEGDVSEVSRQRGWSVRIHLPYATDQLSVSSEEVPFGDHDSNVLVRSQMIKEVGRSDWSSRQSLYFGIDC